MLWKYQGGACNLYSGGWERLLGGGGATVKDEQELGQSRGLGSEDRVIGRGKRKPGLENEREHLR